MPSSLLRPRTFVSLLALAIPLSSCVIKLTDQNAPEVNGAVTGAPANCKSMQILPKSTLDGPMGLKYVGRFGFPDVGDVPGTTNPEFDWSGNNISFRFQGTTAVTVKLAMTADVPQDMLFEFIIDGKAATRQITVQTADGKAWFPASKSPPTNTPFVNYLIDRLSTGPHEVTIWKNTEAQKGSVVFQGVDLGAGQYLPSRKRSRKMEVIGDSIMCGYGIEGQNATCPFEIKMRKTVTKDQKVIDVTVPVTENNFLSFTSQAAQKLDADLTTICWSGKGLYLNYKESRRVDPSGALVEDVDAKTTIPQMWGSGTGPDSKPRTLANDGTDRLWDFSKEKPEDKPQVVVISLGTNDFSRDELPTHDDPTQLPGNNVPDGDMLDPVKYNMFRDTYLAFVQDVREKRPDAHIFLATPPMLTDQFPINNARSRLRAVLDYVVDQRSKGGDTKVYAMNLVEMGFRYGLGCDYHPNLTVHEIMTDQLIGAIQSKTCWDRVK